MVLGKSGIPAKLRIPTSTNNSYNKHLPEGCAIENFSSMPKPSGQTKQARKWVFTIFRGNHPEHPKWVPAEMSYMVYQLEQCPSTEREHYQGYVSFRTQKSMAAVKRIFDCQIMHCEICKDEQAAIMYAKKRETRLDGPWEHGQLIKERQRSDLMVACDMIKGGASLRDVAEQHMGVFVRASKGLTALKCTLQVPRIQQRKAICLIGGTGVGKTYWAHHTFRAQIYTIFDPKTPWFDGYQGEDVVLFDDYGKHCMDINALKRYTDIYPVQVPIKGGALAWTPKLVIFTSNCLLENWYPDSSPADMNALKRRINTYNYPDDADQLREDIMDVAEHLGLELREPRPPSPGAAQPEAAGTAPAALEDELLGQPRPEDPILDEAIEFTD